MLAMLDADEALRGVRTTNRARACSQGAQWIHAAYNVVWYSFWNLEYLLLSAGDRPRQMTMDNDLDFLLTRGRLLLSPVVDMGINIRASLFWHRTAEEQKLRQTVTSCRFNVCVPL